MFDNNFDYYCPCSTEDFRVHTALFYYAWAVLDEISFFSLKAVGGGV